MIFMKHINVVGVIASLLAMLTLSVSAQDKNPPELMSYQGYLTGSDGKPLSEGVAENYGIEFRIYGTEEGTDVLWSELQQVTVSDGSFSVFLGQGEAIPSDNADSTVLSALFDSESASHLYIGMTVDGLGDELAPRLRLLSAPYAFLASKAIAAESLIGGTTLLTEDGEVTIDQDLYVKGTAGIFANGLWSTDGDLELGNFSGGTYQKAVTVEGSSGDVTIEGALTTEGGISVSGAGAFTGDLSGTDGAFSGALNIGASSSLTAPGRLGVSDDLFVYDNTILSGYLSVGSIGHASAEQGDGDVRVGDDLFVDDRAYVGGVFHVGDSHVDAIHNGDLGVGDDLWVSDNGLVEGWMRIGGSNSDNPSNDGDLVVKNDLFVEGQSFFAGDSGEAVGSSGSSGRVIIGSQSNTNIGIDGDDIQARDGSSTSTLKLNDRGGMVKVGESLIVGDPSASEIDEWVTEDGDVLVKADLIVLDDFVVQDTGRIEGNLGIYDKLLLHGDDTLDVDDSDVSTNFSDSMRFYSHDGGSIWSVGPTRDGGNGDDELSFSYHNGSSWEGIGYIEPGSDGWKTWSDRRLKKDIEPLEEGVLDRLMRVPAVRYRKKTEPHDSVKQFGFIAQDIAEAFPGFVDENDEVLGLDYARISTFTVAGIQELRREKDEEIQALEKANQELQQQNEALQQRFEELMSRLSAVEELVQ